ncbi:MAG: outer membrane lipoprotein carrier protein LolA [Myxococcota bacterium]|nr:outer membrane lipoprotein carrier protein LolA [Myxococcota bacterium]
MTILFLTALTPLVAAETVPTASALDALLTGLKTTYADVDALQADFTQVTRSAHFGEGPAQGGQIILGRPRMMRIAFTGEAGALFLSDGSDLYVYSPLGNQVIITPDLADKSDGVTDLLSSLSALEERFEITLLPAEEATIALSLTPKDDARIMTMQLSMTTDYQLTSLSVTDAFDSTTEMQFSNMTLNPDLPEGVFTFAIPEGASVIRSDEL